jgi:hypothetical protein
MNGQPHHRPLAALTLTLAVAVLLLAGCSGSGGAAGGSAAPAPTALGPRPTSTAKLTILSPHNGQTVHTQTPQVRLGLAGAKLVALTSTHIRPDQGHVHLLVDGKLVAMNYGLDERLPKLTPGQHLVQVEFVAADHAPFDPRVLAQAAFIVTP